MANAADGWPVFIPLIVGLAPGLIYWLALPQRETKIYISFYYFSILV